MAKTHEINSPEELDDLFVFLREMYEQFGFFKSTITFRRTRSLSQNALFHKVLSEAAVYYLKLGDESPQAHQLEAMKRAAKLKCYGANKQAAQFLVMLITNPYTKETKLDVTSSADWDTGQMKYFLDWFFMTCAEDGLLLQAEGEYAELSETADGT